MAIQPPCPIEDEQTQQAWDTITKALADYIKPVDAMAIFMLCRSWSVYQYWQKRATSEDVAEAYKISNMTSSAFKQVQSQMAKFGLTPKDRKLAGMVEKQVDAEGTDDSFARFLARHSRNPETAPEQN